MSVSPNILPIRGPQNRPLDVLIASDRRCPDHANMVVRELSLLGFTTRVIRVLSRVKREAKASSPRLVIVDLDSAELEIRIHATQFDVLRSNFLKRHYERLYSPELGISAYSVATDLSKDVHMEHIPLVALTEYDDHDTVLRAKMAGFRTLMTWHQPRLEALQALLDQPYRNVA